MAQVTAELSSGTKVTVRAGRHSWTSDEPASAGGGDSGPNPYELLLGSLASCVALTLRLYANHKQLELESVEVELAFDRIHAADCERCDERSDGRVETIDSKVTIRGRFDASQRERLTQIAARCPVHKTLAQGMQIFDTVSFQEPDR